MDVDTHLSEQEVITDALSSNEAHAQELERVKIESNKICIREDLAKEKMVVTKESSRAVWRQYRCLGSHIQSTNRYVDGIRYRDPKKSPGTADHDHEQPTLQLEKSDDYIFMNGNGRTSFPVHTVTITSRNLRSRKLSVDWYDMNARQRNRWSNELRSGTSEDCDYVPKGWKP